MSCPGGTPPPSHNTSRVPTQTGKTGKPGKMGEVFPVREKSGNFRILPESHGKVREFSMREKSGKIRSDNNIIILWGKCNNSCFQT